MLRYDAELMLRRPSGLSEKDSQRLQRIVKSVDEIGQSLESTYSLAYARFEDIDVVNLHGCVQDILESLGLEAAEAGLTIINLVERNHEETLSRHALMTVLRNIVRNAILHAAPAAQTNGKKLKQPTSSAPRTISIRQAWAWPLPNGSV